MIIRLSDVLIRKGFFDTYNASSHAHFIALFGDMTETDINALDNLLSDIYGDLPLLKRYSDMIVQADYDVSGAITRIVSNCDLRYYDLWQKYKAANLAVSEMDINAPYSETRTITEKVDGASNRTDTSENASKVFAYDGAAASDSDLNNTSAESGGTETRNREYTETIKKTGDRTAAQIAKSQIDYAKNNVFLDLIFSDIIDVCCVVIE